MGAAFSVGSLVTNESRIIQTIERFCESLTPGGTGWGSKWNASEMSTYLGFDIMGALVFGCDFRTVQEESNRHLANSVLPASMLMYWVCMKRPLRLETGVLMFLGIVPSAGLPRPTAPSHQIFRDYRRQISARQ
jgi:hypothetical protein